MLLAQPAHPVSCSLLRYLTQVQKLPELLARMEGNSVAFRNLKKKNLILRWLNQEKGSALIFRGNILSMKLSVSHQPRAVEHNGKSYREIILGSSWIGNER